MGRLPHHQIPRRAQDRRPDAAATGPAAARRRRIRFRAECRRDRQRDLRRDRRALSRIAVDAGAHSGGAARRTGSRRQPHVPLPEPKPPQRRPLAQSVCGGAALFATAAAVHAAAIGIAAAVLPWRSIAPIARPDASTCSAATIERGRQLAALGDCAVCHTVDERRRQCRRSRHRDAVRHHLCDQHHARRRDRDRRVVLSCLRARHARGHPSRRPASLSGVPLSAFRQGRAMPTCRRSMPI